MNAQELVSMITFLKANDGMTVDDIATKLGHTADEVHEILDRLTLVGVPPYSPSDLIDVSINSIGQVFLRYADHFRLPLQLSSQEGVALKFAVEHFMRSCDDDTTKQCADLMKSLTNVMHGKARSALETKGKSFVLPERTKRQRALVRKLDDAIEGRKRLEIEYYSAWRGVLSHRVVHPFNIVEFGAHFYLFAFCDSANETRHFRISRIKSMRVLPETSNRKAPKRVKFGEMQSLFKGKAKENMVLRFAKEFVPHAETRFGHATDAKITPNRSGGVDVTIPLFNRFWALGLALEFRGRADLIEPTSLAKDLDEVIAKILDAHQ